AITRRQGMAVGIRRAVELSREAGEALPNYRARRSTAATGHAEARVGGRLTSSGTCRSTRATRVLVVLLEQPSGTITQTGVPRGRGRRPGPQDSRAHRHS